MIDGDFAFRILHTITGMKEELYAERLEEFYEILAYHYSKSNNSETACQYLKLSGEIRKNTGIMAESEELGKKLIAE